MNILHETHDHDKVWKTMKELRQQYLYENASSLCESTLLNKIDVRVNTMKVDEKLGLNTKEDLLENVTESTLQTAGHMFIYLNSCPPPILGLYTDLFKKATLREIILTLRGILETAHNGEKNVALKIWSKLTDEMKLREVLTQKKKCELSHFWSKNTPPP